VFTGEFTAIHMYVCVVIDLYTLYILYHIKHMYNKTISETYIRGGSALVGGARSAGDRRE